jgi:hypothetical protein
MEVPFDGRVVLVTKAHGVLTRERWESAKLDKRVR